MNGTIYCPHNAETKARCIGCPAAKKCPDMERIMALIERKYER